MAEREIEAIIWLGLMLTIFALGISLSYISIGG